MEIPEHSPDLLFCCSNDPAANHSEISYIYENGASFSIWESCCHGNQTLCVCWGWIRLNSERWSQERRQYDAVFDALCSKCFSHLLLRRSQCSLSHNLSTQVSFSPHTFFSKTLLFFFCPLFYCVAVTWHRTWDTLFYKSSHHLEHLPSRPLEMTQSLSSSPFDPWLVPFSIPLVLPPVLDMLTQGYIHHWNYVLCESWVWCM